MADWFNIVDAQVDPDAPLTSELAYAWRDNPIAIAEGAVGAPLVVNGWVPWDSANVGSGSSGVIYDFSSEGGKTSVTTPVFSPGFDYKLVLSGILTVAFDSLVNIRFNYLSGGQSAAFSLDATDISQARYLYSDVVVNSPYSSSSVKRSFLSRISSTSPNFEISSQLFEKILLKSSSSRQISTASVFYQNGSGFRGGKIYLLKRRTYGIFEA